jgi:dTDP-4-amino-4,6-dideoxygalactose transaminase
MIYYRIPLHLQKVFKSLEYSKGDIPISEEISEKIFSLPIHPYFKRK